MLIPCPMSARNAGDCLSLALGLMAHGLPLEAAACRAEADPSVLSQIVEEFGIAAVRQAGPLTRRGLVRFRGQPPELLEQARLRDRQARAVLALPGVADRVRMAARPFVVVSRLPVDHRVGDGRGLTAALMGDPVHAHG